MTDAPIVVTEAKDPCMKAILALMFTAWADRQRPDIVAVESEDETYARVCNGDEHKAQLLLLFSHWSNDIEGYAAHYGVGLAWKQPDGTFTHADGTIDTLLAGGEVTVIELPPAPSLDHYWYKGVWNAPEPDMSGMELA